MKLLGPKKSYVQTYKSRRIDKGQSLQTQAMTGIRRYKSNLRESNLRSAKSKEHLASSSRHITSYVTLGKLILS